jgi:predicted membrane protein
MNGKSITRWLAISVASPIGGFGGVLVADWLCRLTLGGLNAHGDVAAVLGTEALGVLIGASVLPFFIWYLTRQARS